MRRGPSPIVIVLCLCSCSPYLFQEEVKTFGAGVEQASKLLQDQRAQLGQARLRVEQGELEDLGFPRATLPDKCIDSALGGQSTLDPTQLSEAAAAASRDCRLSAGSVELGLGKQMASVAPALAAIESYSDSLHSIVTAGSRTELAEAATKACGSAKGLATTTAADAGSSRSEQVGTATEEVCGVASQAGTLFFDRERLKVLRRATIAADPNIASIAKELSVVSDQAHAVFLRNELNSLQQAADDTVGLTGPAYFKALEAAQQQETRFQKLASSEPGAAFKELRNAHAKLTEEVNDPDAEVGSAIEATQRFYESAKKAADAIEALSKPAEASSTLRP